jgi:hypothetical protein
VKHVPIGQTTERKADQQFDFNTSTGYSQVPTPPQLVNARIEDWGSIKVEEVVVVMLVWAVTRPSKKSTIT